jgi:RND family efflux transporter MFP subunit
LEENGETEAVERAEVRPEVKGILEEIRFVQGQSVKKGDVLYVIEKTDYEAAYQAEAANLKATEASVKVAEAAKKTAEVAQIRTQLEVNRQKKLFAEKATAESNVEQAQAEFDASVAGVESAAANILAAQADVSKAAAAVDQAKTELDRTEVKAKIDGNITRTEVKIGNLIEEGVLLATVIKSHPIWANFNISERDLLALQRASNRPPGEKLDLTKEEIRVDLQLQDDNGFPIHGRLDYYDPEVDKSTGTLGLRAVFDNEDHRLRPGFYVRARVAIGKIENALLVPEQALGQDQTGAFLMIVAGDNTVQRKQFTVGNKYGAMVVIQGGIEKTDSVIIEGLQRARPGSKVNPKSITLTVPPEALQQDSSSGDNGAGE